MTPEIWNTVTAAALIGGMAAVIKTMLFGRLKGMEMRISESVGSVTKDMSSMENRVMTRLSEVSSSIRSVEDRLTARIIELANEGHDTKNDVIRIDKSLTELAAEHRITKCFQRQEGA